MFEYLYLCKTSKKEVVFLKLEVLQHKGFGVKWQQWIKMIMSSVTSSILSAVSVSLAGVIGFVGLIVPHIMRNIFGPGHLKLIPLAVVGGGFFLLLSDTIGRSIAPPFEVPVGIITGFFGGIFFLVFMVRRKGV